MKNIVLVALLIVAFKACVAEQEKNESAQPQPLSKKEFLRLKAGGGKIVKPGTQKGLIVFVNAQNSADRAWIESQIAYLTKELGYGIALKDGSFSLPSPKVDGEISIFIIDDAAIPTILLAPENRWAAVNVYSLKDHRQAFFEARVRKEVSRVFAMLCGGMASNFQLSLMGPVSKVSDLDVFPDSQVPFDILNRIQFHLKSFGVEPAKTATYKQDFSEGWAPAPTNAVQKLIWDEVHSIPQKPIKIEFDPKKGK